MTRRNKRATSKSGRKPMRKRSTRTTMPPFFTPPDSPPRRSPPTSSKRMPMRKWLEKLMDNNSCKGLRWKSRESKIFTISWHHASSQGFDQAKHADVFIQWARYTGKEDTCTSSKRDAGIKVNLMYNSKTKSNFRCALRSLNDCIEISERDEGRGDNPIKTFQFIDPSHPEFKRKQERKKGYSGYKKIKKEIKYEDINCDDQHSTDTNKQETDWNSQSSSDEYVICGSMTHQIKPPSPSGTPQSETHNSGLTPVSAPAPHKSVPSFDFYAEVDSDGKPSITLTRRDTPSETKVIINDSAMILLPNFEALGIKSKTGENEYINSFLGSGGSVTVKQPAKETLSVIEVTDLSDLGIYGEESALLNTEGDQQPYVTSENCQTDYSYDSSGCFNSALAMTKEEEDQLNDWAQEQGMKSSSSVVFEAQSILNDPMINDTRSPEPVFYNDIFNSEESF